MRPTSRKLGVFIVACALVAPAGAADVRQVKVQYKDKIYRILSDTYVDATPAQVFELLSDYDRWDELSKTFVETRYLERDGAGNGKVYTRMAGCMLFFCKELEVVETLEIHDRREIMLRVIPAESDVDGGNTRWRIESEGAGTRLRFASEMEPGFWVPPLIGPWVIKRKLRRRGQEAAQRLEELAKLR